MWTRKDFGILTAAALATFGLTVGTFWPRLANAVDGQPAPTTDVKTPTLSLGTAQVTARIAKDDAHAVILTIKNTSDEPAAAAFRAMAQIIPPISPMSRSESISMHAWSNDYALNLKPGETQTLTVTLPDAAFNVPPTPAQSEKVPEAMRTVAGKSELVLMELTTTENRARKYIVALQLVTPPTLSTAPVQVSNAIAEVSRVAKPSQPKVGLR